MRERIPSVRPDIGSTPDPERSSRLFPFRSLAPVLPLAYARRHARRRLLYRVKANDPAGRTVTFACGTADQALEKTWELQGRGFRDIFVADPAGKEWAADAFERFMDEE